MDRTARLVVGPQTCAKLKVLTYVSEQRSLYYFKNARAADLWPFIINIRLGKKVSLHMIQVAHKAETYPGF